MASSIESRYNGPIAIVDWDRGFDQRALAAQRHREQAGAPRQKMILEIELTRSCALNEMKAIVETCEPKLSFGGHEYVESNLYPNAMALDKFVSRVLSIGSIYPAFEDEEREHGRAIKNKIDRMYEKIDRLKENACLITKILIVVKAILFCWSSLSEKQSARALWELEQWIPFVEPERNFRDYQ